MYQELKSLFVLIQYVPSKEILCIKMLKFVYAFSFCKTKSHAFIMLAVVRRNTSSYFFFNKIKGIQQKKH